MKSRRHWLVATIAVVCSLSLVLNAQAQDQDSDDDLLSQAEFGAAIYTGTCDDLDDEIVFQLGAISTAAELADGEEADVEVVGFQDVGDLLVLRTNLETGIEALFQQDEVLSIVVRDGEATDDGYVACGELGGIVVNGQVAVGLTGPDEEDDTAGPTEDDDDNDAAGLTGTDDDDAETAYYGVAIFGAGPDDLADPATLTPVRVYVFASVVAEPGVLVTPTVVTATEPPTEAPADPAAEEPAPPVVEEPDEPATEPPASPTSEPTVTPTATPPVSPTTEPTPAPTEEPTTEPTNEPTTVPTDEPDTPPTEEPDDEPSDDEQDDEPTDDEQDEEN